MKRPIFKPRFHNGDNGRDSNGRFAVGNSGGPGRPRGFREQMQAAFNAAYTTDDIRLFADRLRQKALDGDHKSLELLLNRILGPAGSVFLHGLVMPECGFNPNDAYL